MLKKLQLLTLSTQWNLWKLPPWLKGLTALHSKYSSPLDMASSLPSLGLTTRRWSRSVLLASSTPVQTKQDTCMASSWPATCLFKWNKTPLWQAVGQQHACSNETRRPYGKQLASNMPVQMKRDALMASSWPAACLFKWNETPLWQAVGQQHACSNETRHPYGKQLASSMPVQTKQGTCTASSWPAARLFKRNKTPVQQAVVQSCVVSDTCWQHRALRLATTVGRTGQRG